MPVNVVMPQMGESVIEGTVSKWLKKIGDTVARDEPLLEISTDKVDAEVPAPAAGIVREIKIPEGQTVAINTVLAVLEGEAEAAAPAPAAPAPARTAVETPAAAPAATPTAPPASRAETEAEIMLRTSPVVRRLAQENNVELRQVAGTGQGGRVSKKDLLDYLEKRGAQPGAAQPAAPAVKPAAAPVAPSPAAAPAAPVAAATAPATTATPAAASAPRGAVEIVPMTIMRKRIAEHMVMSKRTSPHVYSVFQADVSQIAKLRDAHRREFAERSGLKLTFMPFFCLAVVEALKQFPIINASVQQDSIVYKRDINLGIAVALDWGLIVPVIKHAEDKNFLGLQRGVTDLAERARSKKLAPDEIQDGTFTITNYGIYGGLYGLPVINQPQVAILGVGGIHKTPVVAHDAIAIREIVHLTLSFDHRVIDGSVADQFLARIKEILENWDRPLL